MMAIITRLLRWKRMFNPLLVCYRCDGGAYGTEDNNERRGM